MPGSDTSDRERPETYNDWVSVVENNDPAVTAQLIVDEISRLRDTEDTPKRRGERFEVPEGVGIRVLVDGDIYTVDEFLEGDPVLRPRGEHGGVRGGPNDPTVELHFVPADDDIAELYTTGSDRGDA